jgi:methylmalonyl-CoA carboxyltransferase large subunit
MDTNNAASISDPVSATTVAGLLKVIEGLTAQLAVLNGHLGRIQFPALPGVAAEPVAAQAAPPEPEEFSEELLLAISAAVAAYLGKRPRIRAIRLVGTGAWGQQGRVFVQASHQLNVQHDA